MAATDAELLEFLNQPGHRAEFIEAVLELRGLNDIGEKLSAAIMRARDALGGFSVIGELDAVRGIGPIRIERMRIGLAAFLARREAAVDGARFDPDLPSMLFDFEPVEGRAASFAHMARHLVAPLQAGAGEYGLAIDAAGQVTLAAGARLPLIAVAPRRPLLAEARWRVGATIVDPVGEPARAPLMFEPFTEAGAFLPLVVPVADGGFAGALTLALRLEVSTGGGAWVSRAADTLDAALLVRVIEGNMGRLLFALGSEKLRLRREAREIAAARSLAQASGGWLDRHGADLGVARLNGRLGWRAEGGGAIVIEPAPPEADARYRARLALYRPLARRTPARLAAQLNGEGAGVNTGLPAALGVAARFAVVEDGRRPAAAIALVELGSVMRRGNLLAALRRDMLVRPDAAADADHAARPASPPQRAQSQTLRAALAAAWTLPANAGFAPQLARPLARAGETLGLLGVPLGERVVARAQDDAAGPRFELGLGVEVATLPAGRWDDVAAALEPPPAAPRELAALFARLRAAARPESEDALGAWFWNGCGLTTVRPVAAGLYLSHLRDEGLVITVVPDGAGAQLTAAYDPDPGPGPARRLQWSLIPIDVVAAFALALGGGGARVSGSGLAAVMVTDATRAEGSGPYTYRVEPPAGTRLGLEQYEFLMNLLEAGNPIGVEVDTDPLRLDHVDADGDGVIDPLTVRVARTFRRYRRSPVRSRDNPPDDFPGPANDG